jgi:hypothetical protein
METWDLVGESYVVYEVEHPSTSEHQNIYGVYPKEAPLDPGNDPWVYDFLIARDKHITRLYWKVVTKRDVRGFNVYLENDAGELIKINPAIVKPDAGDILSYSFLDERPVEGFTYALELVRYTPDTLKLLFREKESRR